MHTCLPPALTWRIAAELADDCITTDHRSEHVRAMSLPAHALDAVWACRTALVQVTGSDAGIDADSADLADLLSYCLDCFHSTDLRSVIEALDRVLAVLSLDPPAARTLMTTFALSPEAIGGLNRIYAPGTGRVTAFPSGSSERAPTPAGSFRGMR